MSDNMPWGVSESDIPGNNPQDYAYNTWFRDSEAQLLKDFTEEYLLPEYGVAVPVKEWDGSIKRAWDKFVARTWEAESDHLW